MQEYLSYILLVLMGPKIKIQNNTKVVSLRSRVAMGRVGEQKDEYDQNMLQETLMN